MSDRYFLMWNRQHSGIKKALKIVEALNVLARKLIIAESARETFGNKKCSLIMDKEQPKCFHPDNYRENNPYCELLQIQSSKYGDYNCEKQK